MNTYYWVAFASMVLFFLIIIMGHYAPDEFSGYLAFLACWAMALVIGCAIAGSYRWHHELERNCHEHGGRVVGDHCVIGFFKVID